MGFSIGSPKVSWVVAYTLLPAVLCIQEVLTSVQDSPVGDHLGAKGKRSPFYWPGQKKNVESWCNNWFLCNSRKSTAKAYAPLQPTENFDMPKQWIPETERGNRYILVVGDYLQNGKKRLQSRTWNQWPDHSNITSKWGHMPIWSPRFTPYWSREKFRVCTCQRYVKC